MIARVAIEKAASGRLFDYAIPPDLTDRVVVGARVRLPFGNREASGFVVEVVEQSDYLREQAQRHKERDSAVAVFLPNMQPAASEVPVCVKSILSVDGAEALILPSLIKLARWMSQYYCAPIERCVQALLPAPVRNGCGREKTLLYVESVSTLPSEIAYTVRQRELYENIKRVGGGWLQSVCREFRCAATTIYTLQKLGALVIENKTVRRSPFDNRRIIPTTPLPLNEGQLAAMRTIEEAINVTCSGNGKSSAPKPILLFGVTGSGKTEVYLQAIARTLECGKGAITLVPEIALTPQTLQRFRARFGQNIAALHSALSDGERQDEWRRIRNGEARVVVGPRSAIFAPVRNLGLIIVDEEHEPSYKQDETPRYNARDVAVMRASMEKCVTLLGSATPALESWKNALSGKYLLAKLPKRASEDASMPLVHIVDMRIETARTGKPAFFSKTLLDAISDRLMRNEQTILFLNRRGYATSLVCPSCGYVAECKGCDVAFTYHRHDDALRCHICGQWQRPSPKCPKCGDENFKYSGLGTQRIEQIVKRCFPSAKVARMDADSTSRKTSHDDILSDFRAGRTQILIGTQMIAKGLDFPNVTLVGIMMADSSLHIPDFRAGERTFQLLAQVSGRAGRGAATGEVVVQTYTPDHPAIQMAQTENFEGFALAELPTRRDCGYPPYSHVSCVTFTGRDEVAVCTLAERFAQELVKSSAGSYLISDPYPAALAKVANNYRYQIMLRAPSVMRMLPSLNEVLNSTRLSGSIRIAIDIDAVSIS